ncbi:hypothetical protein DQ04_15101020 [Trypanosoma grayi]|uniref:hypothetical protein n=1 Tax=Trypanosoma grayi TaxID=71804 RepID=UPI0004F4062C|nr:hypothetical protein DQ04_15101020 [Trypanosoma grayi]KEG06236.1 hypothetical protein DQ04_15101020 [Trypanosoma grayi]
MDEYDAVDADELVARAIGSAASRQQHERRRGPQWDALLAGGDDDSCIHPPSISVKQLLQQEEAPQGGDIARPIAKKLDLDADAEELTAIQSLIDTQYASCTSSGNVADGNDAWRAPLPPRPVPHSVPASFRETSQQLSDIALYGAVSPPKRASCSEGVQCDMGSARRAGALQQQQQLRQVMPSDPVDAVRLLAQRVRALEMDRFGHSEVFTSKLLQQL